MSSKPTGESEPTPDTNGTSDTQISQSSPHITHSSGVPGSPQSKAHCEITCKIEKTRWDKFKDFAEISGIAVLAVYAGFTIAMYFANKQAADAATKAAEAAQRSADIAARALDSSNEALHLTERPWVGVERVDGDIRLGQDEPLNLNVTLINSGRAPALKLELKTQIGCTVNEAVPSIHYTERDAAKFGHFVLVPNQEFHGTFEDANSKVVCTPDEMDLVRTKKGYFYVLGTVYYTDGFKIKHHTDFCAHIKPGQKGFPPCQFHNEAD
jgi:hypothetical protein